MKQTQRDIKYIIKRILIGVGIAIVLFNLKKCNVYAQSYDLYLSSSNNANQITMYSSPPSSSYNVLCETITGQEDIFNFYLNYSGYNCNNVVFKDSSTNLYYFYIMISPTSYDMSSFSYISFGMPRTNNLSNTLINFPTNAYIYDSSNNLILNTANSTTSQLYPWSNRTRPYTLNPASSSVGLSTTSEMTTLARNETLSYYGSNFDIPLYFGTTQISSVDPLANYTKVDLTGYQAVLLVPKNYQTMLSDSSHTNESPPGTFRTYLDLEYYSQECVRGTLINVENVQDIMLNNIGVGTGNIAESVTGTCYQEPTQTIMSYEFDQYSGLKARGLLIYNGSQDWQSGFGTETPFFGTSYVWYDPNMYNAYLVESFDNFNQTISYKDYSGEDQEVTIESLPTFTESMENAIDNVDSPTPTEVNKQKLQAIFQFLKSPFSFLNKLNTTSCTPIDLPFPRSNQNIHLECLSSSVYDRYLPTALKSVIIIIINGLLFYRCTLSNIDIFTDILDPEDNKLEAVQL